MFTCCLLFTVPQPENVYISKLPFGDSTAGENLTLTCASVLPDTVTTPVTATTEWLRGEEESDVVTAGRISVTDTSALTPAVFVSMLTFSPLFLEDSSSYTCRVFFTPEPSPYISTGQSNSTSYTLDVEGETTFSCSLR